MKKLSFLVALLTMLNFCLYAQVSRGGVGGTSPGLGGSNPSYTPPVIVPPTPEVASLQKFVETPVSYHTGIPNISIPIGEIASGNLKAAVSLSYHAGGHRVNEESSWVGLGWNLVAGGQITRTVRGKPDDSQTYGYINTQYTVENALQECSPINGSTAVSQLCKDLTYANGSIGQYNDYEPDEYSFSGMGINGRFMFDQRSNDFWYGRIVQFEGRGVIITPNFGSVPGTTGGSNKIIGWDITDTNGNTYHYTTGNIFVRSQYFPITNDAIALCESCGSGESYIESWNLQSVTTHTGDVIEFEYIQPNVAGMSGRNEVNYSIGEQKILIYSANSSGSTSTNTQNSFTRTSSYVETQRYFTRISRIIAKRGQTELGSIEFNASALYRDDTQSPKKALSSIVIKDKFGNPVKKATLQQDYFQSSTTTQNNFMTTVGMAFSPDINSFFKRLYLEEVVFEEIVDSGTPDTYSYQLTYNYDSSNNPDNPNKLPGKHSFGQDHWGFYNGSVNNQSLVPPLSGLSLPTTGNRSVNPLYTQACMLTEIKFPEGGKTVFTYENNTKGIVDRGNGVVASTLQVEANPAYNYTINTNGNFTTYTFERVLTIENNAVGLPGNSNATTLRYDGFTSVCSDTDEIYMGGNICDRMFFRIYREGATTPSVTRPIWQSGQMTVNKGERIRVEIEITAEETVINGLGHTVIDYDINSDETFVALTYDKNVNFGTFNDYMGGLRVSDIKNYDHTGELLTRKYYQYENGYMLSRPTYLRSTIMRQQDQFGQGTILDQDHQTIELVSQSWIPLVSTQAKYQGYETVREVQTKVENGMSIIASGTATSGPSTQVTTRTYMAPSGFSNIFPGAPYEPLINRNNIKIENVSGKKITTNDYYISSFRPTEFIWGYRLSSQSSMDNFHPSLLSGGFALLGSAGSQNNSVQCGIYSNCQLSGSVYQIAPSINLLSKQVVNLVEEGEILTQTSENTYESIPHHYNPTKVTTTGSDGKVTEKYMKYPHEDLNGTLLGENRINTVLETTVVKDNFIIDRVRNHYTFDSGNYLPKSVKVSKSQDPFTGEPTTSTSLEERLIFHSYYSNGKIREVSQKDGAHAVYIWGYDQTVPVAKIENATWRDIPSSLYTNIINASNADVNDSTENTLRLRLNELRNHPNLSEAFVTTYTYDRMVGITSITNPRGNTLYYEYDGFNRLIRVKDRDGNIVSENEYHYKN
jgi:YD repeat-containing protein